MKKIKKIFLIVLTIIITCLILTVAGNYVYVAYVERAKVVDKFWDLSLGMNESDLKFYKGVPTEKDDTSWCESCVVWVYKTENAYGRIIEYSIIVKNSKIILIGETGSYTRNLNVQNLKTIEDLTSKYGEPSNTSVSQDQTTRLYSFEKYKIFFVLKKNQIEFYGIYDPEAITPKFKVEAK